MKNKRIYVVFKSDKKKDTCDDENMINSTYLRISKHDTNNHIFQLEKPFIKVQRITIAKFHIILWN